MAESPDERNKRLVREQFAKMHKEEQDRKDREAIQRAKDKKRQDSLNAQAKEEEYNERMKKLGYDRELNEGIASVLNRADTLTPEQFDKELKEAIKDASGFWSTYQPTEKEKQAIKKARNKTKGGFCGLIALGLVGGLGAIGYGAYEGVSAIASALF